MFGFYFAITVLAISDYPKLVLSWLKLLNSFKGLAGGKVGIDDSSNLFMSRSFSRRFSRFVALEVLVFSSWMLWFPIFNLFYLVSVIDGLFWASKIAKSRGTYGFISTLSAFFSWPTLVRLLLISIGFISSEICYLETSIWYCSIFA